MTLIVGNPDETDEDIMATLDLVYEMERRGLFAFLDSIDLSRRFTTREWRWKKA